MPKKPAMYLLETADDEDACVVASGAAEDMIGLIDLCGLRVLHRSFFSPLAVRTSRSLLTFACARSVIAWT